jgi:hypothetical protein
MSALVTSDSAVIVVRAPHFSEWVWPITGAGEYSPTYLWWILWDASYSRPANYHRTGIELRMGAGPAPGRGSLADIVAHGQLGVLNDGPDRYTLAHEPALSANQTGNLIRFRIGRSELLQMLIAQRPDSATVMLMIRHSDRALRDSSYKQVIPFAYSP